MTSKEKIRDIKSVINEFYHNEKCEGRLTECARKSWLLFQEYCDDILQDLERLETLEKENKELKEFQVLTKQGLWNLKQENEKLKKALSIIRNKCYSLQLTEATDEEFNLIKEVLGE